MDTTSTTNRQNVDIKSVALEYVAPRSRRFIFDKSKALKTIALSVVSLSAAVIGLLLWQHFTNNQETDDAYITAHITPVSSRIESNVEQVLIDDNQHVTKGQLLIVLDPRDFQKKVNESTAKLERVRKESIVSNSNITLSAMKSEASKLNAEGDLSGSASEIERASAAIREAQFELEEQQQVLKQKQAELIRADLDYRRYYQLESEGAISTSQRDSARRDYEVAKSACDATSRTIEQKKELVGEAKHQLKIATSKKVQAQGNQKTAQASEIQTDVSRLQNDVSSASIKESDAQLQDDLLQLSYSRIYAPVSGRIGRKTVEVGQRVLTGARLFTITEDDIWVVANYKESQLEKMRIGQPVEIKVDVLPHEKFAGVVDSFSPGTGAQFTLLPPDNATGNFTKIVQRLPVKIRFKGSISKFHDKLAPGLSAIVSTNIE